MNEITSIDGLGLENIGDLSSLLDGSETSSIDSRPLNLSLDMIDEDHEQPRQKDNPGFSRESLAELAKTIHTRGVKSPISVRPHPKVESRYVINHGARRYRASIIANKSTIPAFVDSDYSQIDQIIENLHRDCLTPREIADFIGRELARGEKKSHIAKAIGKSPSFVTQHVTLLDLPDPIAVVFNTGRVSDVTVVNELVTAYKQDPDEVTIWLDDEEEGVTRGAVKLLREFLDDKNQRELDEDRSIDQPVVDDYETIGKKSGQVMDPNKPTSASKPTGQEKLKKAIVKVKHDDRFANLILNRRPSAEGWAWLKYDDDGHEFEAKLNDTMLIAILEG